MSGGGIIVRLIDIVLLLLMGFIAISKIEKKSSVKLPQSIVRMKTMPEQEEVVIVGIFKENKSNGRLRFTIESKQIEKPNLESVLVYIKEKKKFFEKHDRKLKVRIRSDWDLPIKYTMKLAKECQKQDIKVGIDVEAK